MATNFRIPFKNAVIAKGLPTSGAGSVAGDPVRSGGLNGANLWGTGKGQGVPTSGGYGMIALDGVIVYAVNITSAAVNENDPIYITPGGALSNTAASNTLFGYADEPGAIGAATKIGVRISNAVGA